MKKISALILSAALIFLMSGCVFENNPPAAPETTTDGKPFFQLEHLPDIGEYKTDNLYRRRYPDYTDHLIPSDDYGPLYIYCGEYHDYLGNEDYGYEDGYQIGYTSGLYGLMTADGEVVTDSVYSYISSVEFDDDEDKFIYVLQKDTDYSDDYDYTYEMTLCAPDGSWAKSITVGVESYITGICDNRIVLSSWDNEGPHTYIFDTKGNQIADFTTDYNSRNYSHGYIVISDDEKFHDYESSLNDWGRFYDTDGNLAFDEVCSLNGFNKKGNALIQVGGYYGIMNCDGSYIENPVYPDGKVLGENYFSLYDGESWDIYNPDGTILKNDYLFNDGYHYIEIIDKLYKSDWNHYYDIETDEPVVYKDEDGVHYATSSNWNTKYFTAEEEECSYLFDINGNLVFKGKGKYIYPVGDQYIECESPYDEDSGRTVNYFNLKTGKKIFSFNEIYSEETGPDGKQYNISTYNQNIDGTDYIISSKTTYRSNSDIRINKECTLYCLKTGKPVFENAEEIEIMTDCGKVFISVYKDGIITVYDDSMNKVLRITSDYND